MNLRGPQEHFCHGRERKFIADCENEDGRVVEENAKGHPAKCHGLTIGAKPLRVQSELGKTGA